ncbi:MAG: chromate transporter [Acholeplasmatales bacterium]|jgi:chromate transporter|nr:chromate transporter [Acholeplasmataceae bacterium]MDY0115933.1 chromate transporter [Acholeplasmatales bacterium]MCK9289919.1 chromate transporter [Acholeplasmataceae bacterium]MCK9428133.1 chromate transporter [Acholeplasmataceae bacterium]MDD4090506.1 chromate transporter [Acholeplasmataceae bacterium]
MIVKLIKLFFTFFKIGLFTFGGGYAMIPMIQQELLKGSYLTQAEIIEFIGISEATPGPFAVNIATFTGVHVFSEYPLIVQILTGFTITLGLILPSFIIILLIAMFSSKIFENKYVHNALKTIPPLLVGFIFAAFLHISLTAILGHYNQEINFDYKALIIFAVVFLVAHIYKKASPIFLIILSGLLGLFIYGVF